ncbi:unnamed protein product [Phytophthora lilii]|uniref:Unnamed protein product n=1 Tax=Phytophthora lilii TaxID=2077276 RepID=A0A9W7CQ34_9STRA|nr:unnamed protein product [Phytophthora lilii]
MPMVITLAAKKKLTIPTKTIRLTLYMDDFKRYVNDFLVIDVPENQDILLGMPWLKANNPDIDWVEERVSPRTQSALPGKNGKKTKNVKRSVKTAHKPTQPAIKIGGERHPVSLPKTSDGDERFTSGFYSVLSGETKYISGKQFKRLMKKPNDIECVFIIRPKTEKESGGDAQRQIDIDSYREHPAYPVLLKHKSVFQKKLPSALPPRGHGEHEIKVDTDEAIFRRQWRLSPAQEKVIMDWVEEMLAAGLIRPSTSPHGAPTFCVKKPVGWRIVHAYRALNSHTVRRTLPMPRKDKIIDNMRDGYWFSCMDFLSGYYQFRVRDADVPYTAFQASDGSYECLVLPMGLSNAPATFNAGVRRVLADLSDICQSYFDNIYVCTKSKNLKGPHLTALDRVLTRLEKHNFYIKLSKCVFCVAEIPCLGDYRGQKWSSH